MNSKKMCEKISLKYVIIKSTRFFPGEYFTERKRKKKKKEEKK